MTLNRAAMPLVKWKRDSLEKCLKSNKILFLGYSGNDADIYPALGGLCNQVVGIYWCYRAYSRGMQIEHLLNTYGEKAESIEYNLNLLINELAYELNYDLSNYCSLSQLDSQGYYPKLVQWAESLSIQEILEIIGRILLFCGEAKEAYKLALASAKLTSEQNHRIALVRLFEFLGDLCVEFNEVAIAEKYYKLSLNMIWPEGATSCQPFPELIHAQAKIGEIYLIKKELDAAENLFTSNVLMAEQINDLTSMAFSYEGIGDVYFAKGKRDEALKFFQLALSKYEELGEVFHLESCYRKVAGLHFEEGRYDSALKLINESLRVSEENWDVTGMALANHNIGLAYYHLSNFQSAIKYYRKALDLYYEINAPDDQYENTYKGLLSVYKDLEDREALINLYGEMHIHFHLQRDDEKATYYNDCRLQLVAQLINENRSHIK